MRADEQSGYVQDGNGKTVGFVVGGVVCINI